VSVAVHRELTGPEDAPVLLLSNSLGTDLSMWDPQVGPLSERFRVIRYDTRGHGRSPVPEGPYDLADLGGDALALFDRLGVERAHVAGVSLGGMTAMWLAIHAPERVERLVPCFTSARLGPREQWVDRAAKVRAGGTEAVATTVAGRWLTPARRAAHPEELSRLRAMLAATPAEGYAACCGAIERMDIRGELAGIRAPTLVIVGEEDPATPPEHGELIASLIPGARLEVLEHAAHLGNLERPEAYTSLVLDFLGG
jgi:3-oxoadipate enol-lactonase